MLDFSAIPVKLGEPKRLACLGFGAGALILGVAVENVSFKYILFGTGLVAMAMTLAGYLNPVTVSQGLAPGGKGYYGAIPAGFGQYVDIHRQRGMGIPARTAERYGSGSGIVDVGKGRVMPVYGEAYGTTGATAFIPAGPDSMGIAQTTAHYQAEPAYMRYVTGVENEGKVVGQGG